MNNLLNVLMRIVAVFAASALPVIGAGSVFGMDVLSSMMMAGLLGVSTVVEALSRAFLDDGKLSTKEINEAFAKVDKRKPKE
jgi:hypothetical protein